MQILLDGATLSGEEKRIVERYLQRIPPPFRPSFRESRKPIHVGVEPAVLLDAAGELMDSIQFASWITTQDRRTIFAVGGSYGFVSAWPSQSFRFSLGRLTLPHKLAVAVFAEQLYRAYTYRSGHPYHH